MEYKKRYNIPIFQNAYKNACDCIMYGYGVKYWNSCGLDESQKKEVWKQAFFDMTESRF